MGISQEAVPVGLFEVPLSRLGDVLEEIQFMEYAPQAPLSRGRGMGGVVVEESSSAQPRSRPGSARTRSTRSA